jgi:ADP-ribose pyrophosphatase YjhB (NUDIX family)
MIRSLPQWLRWAREIQALAQTGLHYARNSFERERAQRLLEIAAEMVAEHSEMGFPEVEVAFAAQEGYVTPKVDVRGAVFVDGRILLVREAMDGGWTLPGGWAEVGESPRTAVEREVREEAGIKVRAARLIGIYDANRIENALALFHAYKLVFLCDAQSRELSTSSETTECGFFNLDALPEPLSRHRTTNRHIADAATAYRNSSHPTTFD